MSPASMMGRIFKAEYFPHSGFLYAQLGSNPSLIWRSIWSARRILELGLRWKVGSGVKINIWNDFWLPDPYLEKIKSARVSSVERVSDLIMPNMRVWNEPLIDSIFSPEEAFLIRNIPLSSFPQENRVVWGGEGLGIYIVRSGYRLLLQTPNFTIREHTLFKQIWGLSCPPKIKIALWKFVNAYVPTKSSLYDKRIASDPTCPRCHLDVENVNHVFRLCVFARDVWVALEYTTPVHVLK
ncbi:uncharacterized protein LOC105762113 [Gossypium raimondii]|uniref:uncharacterized protein LOC105762113 n=1 Tax=Gossypium raimondii TaxID=29730 RepID=UPI00063AC766|nr:uncharacterized protein LOC105762113 [Gossypium raimondii]